MAITKINLSDPITSIVLKSNDISSTLGDPALLVTGDSDVVSAVNSVRRLISPFDDSDEIIAIGRTGFSVSVDSGFGNLAYDSAAGKITLTGPSDSDIRSVFAAGEGLTYDSAFGQFSIATGALDGAKLLDSSLSFTKFRDLNTLNIRNSSGSVLKTLYSPGL